MSLMTYDDAFPWAESIRAELVAAHMPPWNADEGYGEIKRAHTLTPKELDVILTWATGGNPRGSLDQKLPEVELKNEWKLGAPDLALKLPAEFTLAADKMEDTQEFTLPTGTTEARWVRAVDLLPGTPSIVRSATIFVKGDERRPRAAAPSPEQRARALAARPGSRAERRRRVQAAGRRAKSACAFTTRRRGSSKGKPLTDRSTVGIYFAPSARHAQELLSVPIDSPAAAPGGADQTGPLQPHARRGRAGARAQPRQGAGQHLAAGGSGASPTARACR